MALLEDDLRKLLPYLAQWKNFKRLLHEGDSSWLLCMYGILG